MSSFLAAQADDPFDPVPMLIQADWLEGQGDQAGAEALRGPGAGGIASLHALALDAALVSVPSDPDKLRFMPGFDHAFGCGVGDGAADGYNTESGSGYGGGEKFGVDHGWIPAYDPDGPSGCGCGGGPGGHGGCGDRFAKGAEGGSGSGDGDRDEAEERGA